MRPLRNGPADRFGWPVMKGPAVTDRALIRFLERAGGIDMEGLREAISTSLERAHAAARQMGDTDYLIKMGGATYVVRGDSVTTVLETGEPRHEARAIRSTKK